LLAAACGDDGGTSSPTATEAGGATAAEAPTTVRLGYFPNVTHATAIV